VVLINRIEITVFLSPMIVVFFIIALPLNTPNWLLLVSAFITGLTIDLFMNTPGIASFAMVLAAFLRPFALRLNQPRDGYQVGDSPSAKDLGWSWYSKYSTILVFVFHLTYFIILGFGQDNILVMLWKTILSSLFSLLVIFLFQLFTLNNAHK
jgi:hypothetical protein